MKFSSSSLNNQLLLYISLSFILLSLSVYFVSYTYIKRMINSEKKQVYTEKVKTVISNLDIEYRKLEKTGMIEVYEGDFQERFIEDFLITYKDEYRTDTYPFILGKDYELIAHPNKGRLEASSYIFPIESFESEYFNYTDINNIKCSAYISYYDKWQWYVGYSIPLRVKYSQLRSFFKVLLPLMTGIYLVVLIFLYMLIKNKLKPVSEITYASQEIVKGNMNYKLDINEKNEIGILADNFKKMRNSIQEKIEELTKTNKEILKSEKKYKSLESYLNNILDSIPSILICIDSKKCITICNNAAVAKLGLDRETMIGEDLTDIISRLKPLKLNIESVVNGYDELNESNIINKVGNDTIYEEVSVYPLIGEGLTGAVIRIDDITQKIMYKNAMIQSEKMMALGGLAAGMAHEINNPLAGILQSNDVLIKRLTDRIPVNLKSADEAGILFSSLQDYLEKRSIPKLLKSVKDSGKRASRIVKNMLSFARKNTKKVIISNISELIDETIELSANEFSVKDDLDLKTVKISREYDKVLPPLLCEPSQIQQVLLNLIINAAEEMLVHGTYNGAPPQISIKVANEGNSIRIEVKDIGKGLDQETSKKIFDPFFSTKGAGKGTGLGLSISYYIITENHNGEMTFNSTEEGTTFILLIPVES